MAWKGFDVKAKTFAYIINYNATRSGWNFVSCFLSMVYVKSHLFTWSESIDIAQSILKKSYPSLNGLLYTSFIFLCDENRSAAFRITNFEQKFIQILNTGQSHWICTSNFVRDEILNKNEIYVFDSNWHSKENCVVGEKSKKQIAYFMGTEPDNISITCLMTQQQNNATDCGVFAIANATSLALGENPQCAVFDMTKSRQHLVDCLENREMKRFPFLASDQAMVIFPKLRMTKSAMCQ